MLTHRVLATKAGGAEDARLQKKKLHRRIRTADRFISVRPARFRTAAEVLGLLWFSLACRLLENSLLFMYIKMEENQKHLVVLFANQTALKAQNGLRTKQTMGAHQSFSVYW